MPSPFANLFCKRVSCPSSQRLLAYHQFRLGRRRTGRIDTHLVSCDFCNAELQLLTRHRDNCEESSFAEMPAQLRRLAESLFNRGTRRLGAFPELERQNKA